MAVDLAKNAHTDSEPKRRRQTKKGKKAPPRRKAGTKSVSQKDTLRQRAGRPAAPVRDVDENWIQDRLKKKHRYQKDLAAAWGSKSASVVARVLRGNRQLNLQEFSVLCEFVAADPAEVMRRLGYDVQQDAARITIDGAVTASAQVTYVVAEAGQAVDMPAGEPGQRALRVRADSGPLAAYDGSLVVYRRAEDRGHIVFGRLAVIEVVGEVVPVLGTLARGSKKDTLSLTRFACSETTDVSEVLRTHAVTAIHLA